jgi:hypothetical protein
MPDDGEKRDAVLRRMFAASKPSAPELARYEEFKQREREVLKAGELPEDLVAALKAARCDGEPTDG